MVEYPYIMKTGTVKQVLEKIPTIGIPDKFTIRFIYSLGFKSVNDRPTVKILQFLKFLDPTGTPTERYKNYRDRSKSKQVLGQAIKETYADLFKLYPDAQKQDNNTLQNFFSTHTGLGERTIKSIVDTFKAVSSLAVFDGYVEESPEEELEDNSVQGMKGTNTSLHIVEFVLSEGRKVKIIMPQDISPQEIERLKKLLDAFSV